MWCNHLFGQRNNATERAAGVGNGGNRGLVGGGGVDKILESWGLGNIGGGSS